MRPLRQVYRRFKALTRRIRSTGPQRFKFALPRASKVQVTLFDILGRQVAIWVDDELAAGAHKVLFEAKDLASGLYVYRIRAEEFVQSKKLMLLK